MPRDAHDACFVAECPRCKEERPFRAAIDPDPQRRGPARVEREAAGWLATHPCYLNSAHPKRIYTGRGAAA